ncbi:beta-ketoacyl synthase N-terminal-like domain-containing protein [Streptomyces sp. CB01881]|uniref:beta-ketoacyl synthase N-terminal-like domain-containing protein n=1 Tax=Streptomyces sp. CB01881 TaxID=2078691 RepID=UPI0018840AA0|nr:beta-ketoacyl synthase N-terminal-like domain-containing protein [Streptomyces sp. CB01881]
MTELRILSQARWPDPERADPDLPDRLPPVPGFSASSFNPLVAEAAERCLRARHGAAPAPGRTALLLASASGDRATARAIDEAASSGRRVPPLLFFQSNPNAVLGHIAARWGLTGPVVAISPVEAPPGGLPQDALDLAALLLADGDADHVLIVAAEQADPGPGERADTSEPGSTEPADAAEPGASEPGHASGQAATGPDDGRTGTDRAVAVLVTTA